MEQHHDETPLKSRSARACFKAGMRLYMSNAKKIFRHCYPYAIIYAVVSSVAGTLLLTDITATSVLGIEWLLCYAIIQIVVTTLLVGSGVSLLRQHKETGAISMPARWIVFDKVAQWRTAKATLFTLIFAILTLAVFCGGGIQLYNVLQGITGKVALLLLAVIAVLLWIPMLYVNMKYVLARQASYLKHLASGYVVGFRYFALIFVVTIISSLVVTLVSLVIAMPALIITLAAIQSIGGIMAGDPAGLPHHFTLLTFATLLLNCLLQAWLLLFLLFPFYYMYGSIEKQKEEAKENEKMNK